MDDFFLRQGRVLEQVKTVHDSAEVQFKHSESISFSWFFQYSPLAYFKIINDPVTSSESKDIASPESKDLASSNFTYLCSFAGINVKGPRATGLSIPIPENILAISRFHKISIHVFNLEMGGRSDEKYLKYSFADSAKAEKKYSEESLEQALIYFTSLLPNIIEKAHGDGSCSAEVIRSYLQALTKLKPNTVIYVDDMEDDFFSYLIVNEYLVETT